MKKHHLIPLLLLTTPAHAFEVAPPQIGDNCAEQVRIEQVMGATLHSESAVGYLLESRYDGIPTEISFQCSNNVLIRASYRFMFKEFSQASAFFTNQQAELMVHYGPPTLDQSSDAYLEKIRAIGFEVKEEHKLMLNWHSPESDVIFGAAKNADQGAFVTLDIIPNQSEAQDHSQHGMHHNH